MAGPSPKQPDRAAFARRHTLGLGAFFVVCLGFAGLSGNLFAGLAGLVGIAWLIAAHLSKPGR